MSVTALTMKTIPRVNWPEGEWDDEKDVYAFLDEETGLPCMIIRSQFGALNGYVAIPEGHPLHGETSVDGQVHGGVTWTSESLYIPYLPKAAIEYCEEHARIPKDDSYQRLEVGIKGFWWLGFDCGHYGDLQPGLTAMLVSCSKRPSSTFQSLTEGQTYKNLDYVRGQVEKLARELHKIAPDLMEGGIEADDLLPEVDDGTEG